MTIFVVVTGNDVTYVNVVTEVDTIVVGIRVVEIAVVVAVTGLVRVDIVEKVDVEYSVIVVES